MRSPQIIVGVDGSPAARAAVTWAAGVAVRQHRELVVVHVYDWRVVGARAPIGGPYADDMRKRAEALVAAAVDDARAAALTVAVRGEAVLGSVVPTLVSLAEPDQLLVLGSRGRGGFASLLLGSVGQQVATHADGPVVIVRGRSAIAEGPVVVGTDGSSAAGHAVGIAFDEAKVRHTRLVVVRTFARIQPAWGLTVAPYVEELAVREAYERHSLDEELAPWIAKYPDVPVEIVVVEGEPADSLLARSHEAQLVVVGTRGHGGFAGLLLGSVSHQLIHHAECPVLIAR